MLSDGRNFFQSNPGTVFFPEAAIFLSIMDFNLFGDSLRDWLSPRQAEGTRPRKRPAPPNLARKPASPAKGGESLPNPPISSLIAQGADSAGPSPGAEPWPRFPAFGGGERRALSSRGSLP